MRFLIAGMVAALVAMPASAQTWGATWAAPPSRPVRSLVDLAPMWISPVIQNQTIVQKVRISAGGYRLRLRLSNQYGDRPLALGRVYVRLLDENNLVIAGSERSVAFSGGSSMAIPPHAIVLSDPIALATKPLAQIEVAIFLPGDAWPCTCHADGLATSRISPPGDFTTKPFATASETRTRAFLVGIDVEWGEDRPVIATLGDSITDGYASTPDTDRRWPDRLAERLSLDGNGAAVVNLGISGNRVLTDDEFAAYGENALARFDRDVLATPGITHLVVLEGINDIGAYPTASADALIAGYRQIIARAHQRKIRVILGTLLPYEKAGYDRPDGELVRQAVNAWIREQMEADGMIDFDAIMRDPARPTQMRGDLQADWLHPNDAGYKAMADAVDLKLFR